MTTHYKLHDTILFRSHIYIASDYIGCWVYSLSTFIFYYLYIHIIIQQQEKKNCIIQITLFSNTIPFIYYYDYYILCFD